MVAKELNGGSKPKSWSPSTLLEALRTSFDDLEAYAYINGGDLVLRSEYEVLVIRVPGSLVYWDLEAYLYKLGAQVYECRRGLGFILPTSSGPRLVFHARMIHRENGMAYIAIEPRGVAARGERPRLC
ncbi:hypothetical protein CF15_00995 [Pyrodictium occultum]|uniref:Uncharacterized protein n=1 Tax=Pyrodictium occultum TaxID=2309 RepID=A0A0V8RTT1_PYROC|nr:hypothetical protein CF15_00995 [Pyrodictium occultum]